MLKISKTLISDTAILKMEGRIEGLTMKKIQVEIDETLKAGVKIIILDFEGVYHFSIAGVIVLKNELSKIKKIGGQMFLISMAPLICEVFINSGLYSIFRIFNSYQEVSDFLNDGNSSEK